MTPTSEDYKGNNRCKNKSESHKCSTPREAAQEEPGAPEVKSPLCKEAAIPRALRATCTGLAFHND